MQYCSIYLRACMITWEFVRRNATSAYNGQRADTSISFSVLWGNKPETEPAEPPLHFKTAYVPFRYMYSIPLHALVAIL